MNEGYTPDPDSTPTVGPEGERVPGEGTPEKMLGPYRILEEVGRGGMGIVYKAFHPALKRTVALKVLTAGGDASEEAVTRFHREAEAVAKLGHHPNIVPVYDVGQVTRDAGAGAVREPPLHYIAMHYVEGASLDRLLKGGKLAPRRAASIAMKVAGALQHAHANGILHRDVKPSNILLAVPDQPDPPSPMTSRARAPADADQPDNKGVGGESDVVRTPPQGKVYESGGSVCDGAGGNVASGGSGVPMLTDFGLAKDLKTESRLTTSGVTLGTPQYMPPEQAAGKLHEIDERSDVWALGATLYEMLTGLPPFEGATLVEILQKVILAWPAPPRRIDGSIERDLETICLKCLEKDPARRYRDAEALGADLDRYLHDDPVRARPPSIWYRVSKRTGRNKALVALTALVAVLLAVGAGAAILAARSFGRGHTAIAVTEKEKNAARNLEAQARESLEKGMAVASLLRRANVDLGTTISTLKQTFYSAQDSREMAEVAFSVRGSIDDFEKTVGHDAPTQGAWLALRGWLAYLEGSINPPEEYFRRSCDADPESVLGRVFEAMMCLSIYLWSEPPPPLHVNMLGVSLGAWPPENAAMQVAQARFQELIEEAGAVKGRDDEVVRACLNLLQGYRAIRERDWEQAEKNLTESLRVSELSWVEEELLLSRARVRLFRGAYGEGLEDLDRVLVRFPAYEPARMLKATLLNGRGAAAQAGGDAIPHFMKAVAVEDDLIRRNPTKLLHYACRALTRINMANALAFGGRDPREAYREAIEDSSSALEKSPTYFPALLTRAEAAWNLARVQRERGESCGDALGRAAADAEKACSLARDLNSPRVILANILQTRAEIKRAEGGDPLGDLDRAIELFSEALQLEPDSPITWSNRGTALCDRGDFAAYRGKDGEPFFRRALEDFEKALVIHPKSAALHVNRARAFGNLGQIYLSLGKDPTALLEKAVECCTEALRIDPDFIQAYHNRGRALDRLGDWRNSQGEDPRPTLSRALEDFDAALRMQPEDVFTLATRSQVLSTLGLAMARFGEDPGDFFGRALSDAEEALKRSPGLASAFIARGLAHSNHAAGLVQSRRDGRELFRKATEDFSEALKQNPMNTQAINNRADANIWLGKEETRRDADGRSYLLLAVEDCEKILEANPEYSTAWFNLGRALEALGGALVVVKEDPSDAYRRAAEAFGRVLEVRPDYVAALNGRAISLMSLGVARALKGEEVSEAFRGAIADFEKSLVLSPGEPAILNNLGMAYTNLARSLADAGRPPGPMFDKALATYTKLLEKVPRLWQAHANRAVILQETGRFDLAQEAFDEADRITDRRLPFLKRFREKAKRLAGGPGWSRTIYSASMFMARRRYARARGLYEEGLAAYEKQPADGFEADLSSSHYNLACIYSLASTGKANPSDQPEAVTVEQAETLRREALVHLEKAVSFGLLEAGKLGMDPDLQPLRDRPGFKALLDRMKKK